MNYQFGLRKAIVVDPCTHVAFLNRDPLPLPRKTVQLLEMLAAGAGTVLSKESIVAKLWPDPDVDERNLAQHVYVLRKVLAAHGVRDTVETVPRRGYRYTGAIRIASAAQPKAHYTRFRRLVAALLYVAAILNAPPQARPLPLQGRAASQYELGRYFLNLRTADAIRLSREYFAHVARGRGDSPLGYSGLADADVATYDYLCRDTGCASVVADAHRNASEALQRDRDSAAALTSDAMVAWDMDGDITRAEREFRRAVEKEPHYALAHQWYGSMLLANGRPVQAFEHLQAAATDNPVSPSAYAWAAMAAYFSHQFENAADLSAESLRLSPRRPDSIVIHALAVGRIEGPLRAAQALQALHHVRRSVRALARFIPEFGDTCSVGANGLRCDWRLIAQT